MWGVLCVLVLRVGMGVCVQPVHRDVEVGGVGWGGGGGGGDVCVCVCVCVRARARVVGNGCAVCDIPHPAAFLPCSVNDLARIVTTEGSKLGLNVEVRGAGLAASFSFCVLLLICC